MSALMAPGVALMKLFPNKYKMPFCSALYLLPLAILYYEVGIAAPAWLTFLIIGLVLFAMYAMAGWYFQAAGGWDGLHRVIQRTSEGDFTPKRIPGAGGHFGKVMDELDAMCAQLGRVVAEVRGSAHAVALAAGEIAAGNANLSQRTEQQASTLEETASGMEELASTVTQNAGNCKLASGLSQNSESVARQGAAAVHGLVEGMNRIDQSSKRMADITGVIEGIAFQTNILALNAAVEAARAGEQGRGFAVVAGEVRALAQRSAAAAKEIRSLIEQSVDQISDGGKKAVAAGKVIDEIVVSVQQVNQLIGEIAVASAEQSTGVAEINKAIAQLESMTQQNAALVEEASASSLSFQEQADRLRRVVSRFKLAEAAPAAPARAPAPARPAAGALPPRTQPSPRRQMAHQTVGADDEWKEF